MMAFKSIGMNTPSINGLDSSLDTALMSPHVSLRVDVRTIGTFGQYVSPNYSCDVPNKSDRFGTQEQDLLVKR